MTYFDALLSEKMDYVSDMLELVEAHYLPLIETDLKMV